jgi:hypothetical protein
MENTLIPAHTRGAENTAYTTDTTTAQMPSSATALSTLTFASGSGAGNKGDVFTIAASTASTRRPRSPPASCSSSRWRPRSPPARPRASPSRRDRDLRRPPERHRHHHSATAAITWAGTASTAHGISLAYQKGAFAFATADLIMPKGVDFAAREVFDGISPADRAPVRHQQRQVPDCRRCPLRLQDAPAAAGHAAWPTTRPPRDLPAPPETCGPLQRAAPPFPKGPSPWL